MIDKDLLAILACPQSHQPLALATPEQLAALNARIQAGGVKNVGGEAVEEALEGGLVRADGEILYPILEEIPVLLIEEGIALS